MLIVILALIAKKDMQIDNVNYKRNHSVMTHEVELAL